MSRRGWWYPLRSVSWEIDPKSGYWTLWIRPRGDYSKLVMMEKP